MVEIIHPKDVKDIRAAKNLSSGFLTRSDTYYTIQPQKMARGLKFGT